MSTVVNFLAPDAPVRVAVVTGASAGGLYPAHGYEYQAVYANSNGARRAGRFRLGRGARQPRDEEEQVTTGDRAV